MRHFSGIARIAAVAAAGALLAAPVAHASVPTDRVAPTASTIKGVFLTEAEVKKAIGVTTPMVPLPATTVTITSALVTGEQKYSSLGAVFDAYAKNYKGPFQYVSAKVTVASTDSATGGEWNKVKQTIPMISNRVTSQNATSVVAYKGSNTPDERKRVGYAWVYKEGLIAGGECATFTKATTEKQLTTCALKMANAQWTKANTKIKTK